MTLLNLGLNIAMYSAAILICFTGLLFTLIQQRTEKQQNKVYLVMLCITLIDAVTGIVNSSMRAPISWTAYVVLNVMDTIYFLTHTAMPVMFYYYVSCVCGIGARTLKGANKYLTGMFAAAEIPVILNPLLHLVFRYDRDGTFHRGWAEVLVYVVSAVFLLMAMKVLLSSWNALTAKRRMALIYFFGLLVLGVGIQMLFMNIKCELFFEAVALIGVMVAIEDEEDRIDPETELYNRKALQNDVDTYISGKRGLYLICIKIQNADIVGRSTKQSSTGAMARAVSGFLRSIVPRYCIYSVSPATFILAVLDNTSDEVMSMAENISRRFENTWSLGGDAGEMELLLNAVLVVAEVPKRLKSSTDVFYMADVPIPPHTEKKILSGSDLDYLLRRAAVEDAVGRGLEEGNFEVYYQPTFYLKDRKLHGAEALLRLHDSVIGNIPPDEFIPIAEQMGLIDDIDDFVLKEVCKLVRSGVPMDHHMDCINVNLSVIECQQPGFVSHIKEVVDGFGIENHRINFEITESVAASDYKLLSYVVEELKNEGFLFSMDDYGTGYSNMQSIFSLDFDVVKIDKSILWSAEESELGRIILENSVRMIKQMGRKILVEGVETEAQIELLSKLEVDYLQGFYFSKPLPMGEFMELIQRYT